MRCVGGFNAKIQVRSQKTMKYWAMIPPLASHSRGHMHNPPCHPLHGAGCSSKTLWKTLNHLFDSVAAAQIDLLIFQYTVSIAFDNWQQMIKKVWQTHGSLSNYSNGVAAFIKNDKAILLPVRLIIRPPLGVQFCSTSRQFLDAYGIIICGDFLHHNLQ